MEQNDNLPDMQEPFIPPWVMLVLAAAGILIAGLVFFTQAQFSLIGWGGLGLTVLSLIAWVLMAPEQARKVLTGRTARFGGTAVVVTIVFFLAMIALYSYVRDREWRFDLTQGEDYSLTEASREQIVTLGSDPTIPPIKIIAFYGIGQAGRRDRDTILFDDYVKSSDSKITYEFIDPDRSPLALDQYTKPDGTKPATGQVVVLKLREDGTEDIANSELVQRFAQENITNAVLKVSASGDFRVYFLEVKDGLDAESTDQEGLSELRALLKDRLNWKAEQVSFGDLTSPESEFKLTDTADGMVLVIPGGTAPLADEELQIIKDFVAGGGDLILLADIVIEGDSLATAPNMSAFLSETFGLKVNNDLVIDLVSSYRSAFLPAANQFDTNNLIGALLAQTGGDVVFANAHSLEVSDTAPANVIVSKLIESSAGAFAKTDIQALANGDTNRGENDQTGPLVLAAAAENTETGARLVVFGSRIIGTNIAAQLAAANVASFDAMFYSLIWTTKYDEFASNLPAVFDEGDATDTPLVASSNEVSTINLVTVVLLPFGILAIGVFMWWNNRERETARQGK